LISASANGKHELFNRIIQGIYKASPGGDGVEDTIQTLILLQDRDLLEEYGSLILAKYPDRGIKVGPFKTL
jgi:hypothetical protein